MKNERLQETLVECGFTREELAHEVGVNPKTVERWITQGRPPFPRHRQMVATVLNESELDLWPNVALKAQSSGPEVMKVYPHRSDVSGALWDQLLDGASACVDILVYAGMFMVQKPGLIPTLTKKAEGGVQIRLLNGDRECPAVRQMGIDEGVGEDTVPAEIDHALACLRRLSDVAGIEMRTHRTTLYNSIYRFDDEMIVNPHVYGKVAAHAPAIHLRRIGNEELFTTYTDSFDAVWNNAKPYTSKEE